MTEVLIMRTDKGFYPIEASGKVSLAQEAKDHGELNDHITSVEDLSGNVLWKRATA